LGAGGIGFLGSSFGGSIGIIGLGGSTGVFFFLLEDDEDEDFFAGG
jgi:hypothetical protein